VTGYVLIVWLSLGTSCQHYTPPRLGRDITEKDFKTLTTPLAPVVEPILPPKTEKRRLPAACQKTLSIYCSDNIPLHTIIEKAAHLLELDFQIDSSIRNAPIYLNFSSLKKPFVQMLENICSLAHWRYRLFNSMLVLETDRPFRRTYNVQFLNLTRSSENRISSATDIFSHSPVPAEMPTSQNGENGSNTSVRMNSENNFWKEMEVNLQTLLHNDAEKGDGSDKSAPFSIHKQAGLISVYGTSQQHNSIKEYLDLLKKSVSSQVLIEAKVIEVQLKEDFKSGIDWEFLKKETTAAVGNAAAGEGAEGAGGAGAGGAGAPTDTRNHFFGGHNFTGHFGSSPSVSSVPQGFLSYTAQFGQSLTGILQALQHFGATRTLSSPRLTVMNNQSAILKVARNEVYFKMNYNKHFYNRSDRPDISVGSDIQTVPIGLVLSVQPAIDELSKSVILFLRPTLSRSVGTVSDPSIAIANQNAKTDAEKVSSVPESKIPIIEVKEIDSVLRLKDGEVAILGGLMQTTSSNTRYKTPLLGDVPVIKEAFSSVKKEDSVTEVVILLRVKILDFVPPDSADKRLAHFYIQDPRPIL
jgi:general secretion pathway protein D